MLLICVDYLALKILYVFMMCLCIYGVWFVCADHLALKILYVSMLKQTRRLAVSWFSYKYLFAVLYDISMVLCYLIVVLYVKVQHRLMYFMWHRLMYFMWKYNWDSCTLFDSTTETHVLYVTVQHKLIYFMWWYNIDSYTLWKYNIESCTLCESKT